MSQQTTLKVSKETRNALAAIGNKDDTFDEIIMRLINEHKKIQIGRY